MFFPNEPENTQTNIFFFGETSSGKTTLINTLLSCQPHEAKLNFDFINLLPSDHKENTTYIWIIKSSNDENFSLEIEKEYPLYYTPFEIPDLRKKIQLLNEEQKKLIQQMKANNESYKPLTIILNIPKFISNISLIDLPGISSEKTLECLKKYMNSFSLLFYLKDLTNPENITENIIKFLSNLKTQENSRFRVTILFMKTGKFFEISEEELEMFNEYPENCRRLMISKKKAKVLNEIIEVTQKNFEAKNIEIYDVFFLDLFSIRVNPALIKDSEKMKKYRFSFSNEMEVLKKLHLELTEIAVQNNNFFLENYKRDCEAKLKEIIKMKDLINLKFHDFLNNFEIKIKKYMSHFDNMVVLENYEEEIFKELNPTNYNFDKINLLVHDRINEIAKKELKIFLKEILFSIEILSYIDFDISQCKLIKIKPFSFFMTKNDILKNIKDNEENIIEFYINECLKQITFYLSEIDQNEDHLSNEIMISKFKLKNGKKINRKPISNLATHVKCPFFKNINQNYYEYFNFMNTY